MRHLVLVSTVLAAAGCAGRAAPPGPVVESVAGTAERGRAALTPFKASLRQALGEALARGGPVAAIDVCSSVAPRLAAGASHDGVTVGRASHRLRNPRNHAPTWVEPVLTLLELTPDAGPRVLDLGHGKTGYVEPIQVQPVCLACHGSELSPEVATALARRYPDDEARGYQSGDFRGVFWVELEAGR
jgi:hypothetical protein